MTQVLTLVAQTSLTDEEIAGFEVFGPHTSTERLGERAADLHFTSDPGDAEIASRADELKLDFALQPLFSRARKLLIADMDSTIIEQECLDELAAAVGIGEEIAAITEQAMRGELDFEGALRERVSRLEGVDYGICRQVIKERLRLSKGARTMVQTLKAQGLRTVLVSGGFDIFVSAIAEQCGFDAWHANSLEVGEGDKLTGQVIPPILGREAKAAFLEEEALTIDANPSDAIAIGDGANDLGMIEKAGLGVAYRAKPIVAEAADAAIRHTDLTAILYFLGLPETSFTG